VLDTKVVVQLGKCILCIHSGTKRIDLKRRSFRSFQSTCILSMSIRRPLSHKLPTRYHFAQTTRTLASSAYFPATSEPGPSRPSKTIATNPATCTAPTNLTPDEQDVIARIIRVDQAGELGANWIYRGQKWGSEMRGDLKTAKEVEVSGST
jgi:hypothetical protein